MGISEGQCQLNAARLMFNLKSELKTVLDTLDSRKKTTISNIDAMIAEINTNLENLKYTYKEINNIMSNRTYQRILIIRDSLQNKINDITVVIPYRDQIKGNKIFPRSEIKTLKRFFSETFNF